MDFRIHSRALSLVDELQRVGFEQLRFSRSSFTTHWRIQIYAARAVREQDGFVDITCVHFCVSDEQVVIPHREDSLSHKWTELLRSQARPRHLAGLFALDFPEIARVAYGPDHEYREWFRSMREVLKQDYLPVTWEEAPTLIGPGLDQHVFMRNRQGETKLLPRPPANPFVTGR